MRQVGAWCVVNAYLVGWREDWGINGRGAEAAKVGKEAGGGGESVSARAARWQAGDEVFVWAAATARATASARGKAIERGSFTHQSKHWQR